MQIVIDISAMDYADIMKTSKERPRELTHYERIISKGTPLPKGHGRLIDADALIDSFVNCVQECGCCEHHIRSKYGCGIIEDAPTVLEADKGELT